MAGDPWIWGVAALAFLVAGGIKGLVGMGLPTAALGLMTLALDPRTAISLVLIPMLATNAWQMMAGGQLARTARRYRVFALVLLAGVSLAAFGSAGAPDRFLLGALGAVILLFTWVSWAGWVPYLPDAHDRSGQLAFGLLGGVIGGLTGTWATAIAIYLTARNADKDEFIRATGFLIFVGSLPLAFAYSALGFLVPGLAAMSAAMLVPAFAGMWAGSRIRMRMSGAHFRSAVLLVFAALALNLLRRAFLQH